MKNVRLRRLLSVILVTIMIVALFPMAGIEETVSAADNGDYVTYKQFGAKGDGKTNDYAAIVATHEYANANNKKVKADAGAVYYVDKMDPKNPKGAIIKTDTDWTGAEFIIDDSKMQIASYKYADIKDDPNETKSVTYPEDWDAQCYLFTIEPTIVYEKTWINFNYWWRKENGKWNYYKDKDKKDGDIKIYIGLDPDIASYNNTMYMKDPSSTFDMLNRSFTKDAVKLEGNFGQKALYALRTENTVRWGRNGSEGASAGLRPQEEVVIVNADGTIDPMSKLQWDWSDLSSVQRCYIDDTQLTVKGGKFTTIVNHIFDTAYIHRGISVQRSNVVLDGVEHYLTGEEAEYADHSFGYSSLYSREDAFARFGAPYQGFFRLDHCVNVTLRNCVFSNHRQVLQSDFFCRKQRIFISPLRRVIPVHEVCIIDRFFDCRQHRRVNGQAAVKQSRTRNVSRIERKSVNRDIRRQLAVIQVR